MATWASTLGNSSPVPGAVTRPRLTEGDTRASPACLTQHVDLSYLALRSIDQQANCPQMMVTASVITTEFITREKRVQTSIQNDRLEVMFY